MTNRMNNLLTGLENSGCSEALAVADCLRDIASNGEEQNTDKYLVACAKIIAEYANYIALHGSRKRGSHD